MCNTYLRQGWLYDMYMLQVSISICTFIYTICNSRPKLSNHCIISSPAMFTNKTPKIAVHEVHDGQSITFFHAVRSLIGTFVTYMTLTAVVFRQTHIYTTNPAIKDETFRFYQPLISHKNNTDSHRLSRLLCN